MSETWELLDQLYERGWIDKHKERDYDPRGTNNWQSVCDALDERDTEIVKLKDDVERAVKEITRLVSLNDNYRNEIAKLKEVMLEAVESLSDARVLVLVADDLKFSAAEIIAKVENTLCEGAK